MSLQCPPGCVIIWLILIRLCAIVSYFDLELCYIENKVGTRVSHPAENLAILWISRRGEIFGLEIQFVWRTQWTHVNIRWIFRISVILIKMESFTSLCGYVFFTNNFSHKCICKQLSFLSATLTSVLDLVHIWIFHVKSRFLTVLRIIALALSFKP